MPNLSIAGFPEFKTRRTDQLATLYGVKSFKFVPLASISAYTLLDKGQVLVGGRLHHRPALGSNKYTQLQDEEHVRVSARGTGLQQEARRRARSKFTATLNAVSAKLTTKAMIAMNTAVIVNKKSAKSVAAAFLKANGLT